MPEFHEYRLDIVREGEGGGLLTDPAGALPSLEVTPPPEFGGPGDRWTPEHLFVAAVASCLMTTFTAVAAASGLEVLGYRDAPTGRLTRDDRGRYRMSSVTLRPTVRVGDADQVDKTLRLLDKAERACLISRSVSARVWLEPRVEVAVGHSLV